MGIFASQEYNSWTLTEKLTLFVFIEHVLLILRFVLKVIFPEVPRSVQVLYMRQEMMVHRALENIKVEPVENFSIFHERQNVHQPEVFEHDYLEDQNEVEPKLELMESGKTMVTGMMEVVQKPAHSLAQSATTMSTTITMNTTSRPQAAQTLG